VTLLLLVHIGCRIVEIVMGDLYQVGKMNGVVNSGNGDRIGVREDSASTT